MPPDGDDDYDADLPGLKGNDRTPDPDPADYDDADLPGLDEIDRAPDPAPTKEPARQWTHEELDDWFENDFGGHEALVNEIYGGPVEDVEGALDCMPEELMPDGLYQAILTYTDARQVFLDDKAPQSGFEGGKESWQRLSLETKKQFRIGVQERIGVQKSALNPDPAVDDLTPLEADWEIPRRMWGDRVVDEPADVGPTSPAPGSFKWLVMGAGVALVGLVIGAALLLMNRSDDAQEENATTADTAPETAATTTADTAAEDDASNPPAASGTPDQPAEPAPVGVTYTATKTADLITDAARHGHREIPAIGTSYEATLLLAETCSGDICSYQSAMDFESACCPTEVADYMLSIEWGEREAAKWDVNGSTWTADMSARYAYLDNSDGICVVLLEEVWELTIADTQVIDNDTTAATFTGTITRSDSLDQSVSTQGSYATGQPICSFATQQAVDEWSVAGVAVINPAEAP